MSSTKSKKVSDFQSSVWKYYRKNGRHTLPWRKTRDPYCILISEIMLQQTQVERVIPKYKSFLKKFSTLRSLAQSSLADVLRQWQGLGYNRRAKFLHEAAKAIVKEHAGKVPSSRSELVELPGVGAYTASAVRTFAWNDPDIFIETNIRTVFIHFFFPHSKKIFDAHILPYLEKTLDRKNPREWYFALMDYGAHLKKTEGNASRRSAHHSKQKPFKGSDREVRGAILKALSHASTTMAKLQKLPFSKERIQKQVTALAKEGLVFVKEKRIYLPR